MRRMHSRIPSSSRRRATSVRPRSTGLDVAMQGRVTRGRLKKRAQMEENAQQFQALQDENFALKKRVFELETEVTLLRSLHKPGPS